MQSHAYGTAEINPAAINLHAYPGLVHAPLQHGDFVAFAHNGKPVRALLGDDLDALAIKALADEAASSLGVSFGDVCDALKYLRDTGSI